MLVDIQGGRRFECPHGIFPGGRLGLAAIFIFAFSLPLPVGWVVIIGFDTLVKFPGDTSNSGLISNIGLAQASGQARGIAIFIFVITVAAAEAGIGLALFIKVFNEKETLDVDAMTMLRD